MRGADLLVRTLAEAGIGRIFSLSGNQIMPVYDACLEAGIEIVHTRHEAAAVFMADAWAQLTGDVGVALVTAAPGFANALGALYTAAGSESPVLLLSGDAPVGRDGRGAFQALNQAAMSAPVTKLSLRATAADRLGADVARALATAAAGRPGPVHVALPFDVVQAPVSAPVPPADEPALPSPPAADVAAIADALGSARRPLIVTGPALNRTRAGRLLDRLTDSLGAPVIAMESPRGLKDPSLGALAQVLAEADLIVSLGKRIDFTIGFGAAEVCDPAGGWIVVDAEDGARRMAKANLDTRLTRLVEAEPRGMAEALLEATGPSAATDWRAKAAALIAARGALPPEVSADGRITSVGLCQALQRQVAAAAASVLICDGGEIGQWAQALVQGDERLINGPAGAIGGALCYALAACQARPDATVFVLMGDGTVGFHLAEFETAVRAGTPFVAVIGNDRRWNAEHQIQLRDYGAQRLFGCELSDARYDLAVAGLGGHGEFVTELAGLDAALARAVASGKPACVNVAINGLPAPGGGH